MNNKYIFLRHGQSLANCNNIICSTVDNGTLPEFGLSKLGIEQVNKTASTLKSLIINQDIVIFSSPFSRTIQTSLIIKDELKVNNCNYFVTLLLKEREFTKFELQSSTQYSIVWEKDNLKEDVDGIETCKEVATRLEKLIMLIEKKYKNKTIILVSHGDRIMIAKSIFLMDNPYNHRSYEYIENAQYLIFN